MTASGKVRVISSLHPYGALGAAYRIKAIANWRVVRSRDSSCFAATCA
jgi:hypothetical protein